MKSIVETGHARQAANFEKLISYTRLLGGVYQPGNPQLHITALEQLSAQARQVLDKVLQAKLRYDDAVIDRADCFSNLNKLSTRIVSYLAISGVPAGKLDDARAFLRKINGKRAGGAAKIAKMAIETGSEAVLPRTVSVSQQSYDSKADHFYKLVALVSAEAAYQPNEADLKKEALAAYSAKLAQCNQKVTEAAQLWRMALNERDAVFYSGAGCIHTCAGVVKNYLKAVAGSSSPVYKAVSNLPFIAR